MDPIWTCVWHINRKYRVHYKHITFFHSNFDIFCIKLERRIISLIISIQINPKNTFSCRIPLKRPENHISIRKNIEIVLKHPVTAYVQNITHTKFICMWLFARKHTNQSVRQLYLRLILNQNCVLKVNYVIIVPFNGLKAFFFFISLKKNNNHWFEVKIPEKISQSPNK